MATLTKAAQHLLAWFNLYRTTATRYNEFLLAHPKAQRRGLFADSLTELLYYGY